ncbi:hypothetical protein KCP75_00240 [Salmonella enterica subsp. enterica]|nr:hypothetical protein KCP75_00240 [Salmonella enterica subsp. enterica]
MFVKRGTWSSCIKVTDKERALDAAAKRAHGAKTAVGATDTNAGNIGLPR